jgi:glucose-6-phosphate 1-dehydrogenase
VNPLGEIHVNPLRDPRDRRLSRVPDPCALVVFGATGDLARKKLIPAVYDLANRGLLPPGFLLIGFARRDWGDGDFESLAYEAAKTGARTEFREDVWRRLADSIRFNPGSFEDDEAFDRLSDMLVEAETTHGIQGNAAFYLSIPPAAFPVVLKQMQRTRLSDNGARGGWRRVVVEKPFGTDLRSGQELNALVDEVFTPQDVFRIDHYLGKETVQNLLALRFANALFEPVWNNHHVDAVEITMAEDVGIGGRAGFYDAAGAARDVLQNHLLQLLALTAMEEPVSFSAAAIRTEKEKVLGALSLPADLDRHAVRGQYTEGWLAGERVPVLPTHGQAAPPPRNRDRGVVQEGAAPALRRHRHGGAGQQPAGRAGAARRGADAEVRVEGTGLGDGGTRRVDGLPVRRGFHRVLTGGLRAARARRPAR